MNHQPRYGKEFIRKGRKKKNIIERKDRRHLEEEAVPLSLGAVAVKLVPFLSLEFECVDSNTAAGG